MSSGYYLEKQENRHQRSLTALLRNVLICGFVETRVRLSYMVQQSRNLQGNGSLMFRNCSGEMGRARLPCRL